jgi:hypothetical protein
MARSLVLKQRFDWELVTTTVALGDDDGVEFRDATASVVVFGATPGVYFNVFSAQVVASE